MLLVLVACGSSRGHRLAISNDPDHLYVEVTGAGARRSQLRAGAEAGLASMSFARPVDEGGDLELRVELAQLHAYGRVTACKVKILVFRLPAHDLLAIADGSAQAPGTNDRAVDDCIAAVSATVVRGKMRPLLKRRLAAKR